MRIVVCVKLVPDATASRSFEADHTVDRVSVDGLLSELDEYAVEEALRIRDAASGESEVVAVTMGPQAAADAVRKSLQMGADSGVHVLDEALAGSDAPATSLVLAATLRKLGAGAGAGTVDLVICGMASTDGTMGVVPAMLAERLGLPQLTYANEVTVDDSGGTYRVRVRRDSDQRAAGPLVQGDHGCQEEAGADVVVVGRRCGPVSGRAVRGMDGCHVGAGASAAQRRNGRDRRGRRRRQARSVSGGEEVRVRELPA
jgi:hypothetical protein